MIRHLTGSLWSWAVASSDWVIWKPPSPTMAHTFLSGFANWAPMAAGKPKPMVPAPPLLIQWRFVARPAELGRPHLVLPHVGGDDRLAPGERVEAVEHVLGAQAALLRVLERVLLAPALAHCRSQSAVSAISTCGIRSSITRRASPWIETSGLTILSNSAASMSTWIFTASVQKSERRPVMRSSQRAPIAMMRSQSDHRLVGVGGAVHAQHAEVQRMGLVHGALAEQRVDDRRAQLLRQGGDRLAGVRDHGAVAHVEQRPLGFAQAGARPRRCGRRRRASAPRSRAGRARR